MRIKQLSLWKDKKIELSLYDVLPQPCADGLKIWFDNKSTFCFQSSVNALLSLNFSVYASGTLDIYQGSKCVMSNAVCDKQEESFYCVVSPGNNEISFKYSGDKFFSVFDPEIEGNQIFDFALINPKVEILAHESL